MTQTNKHYFKFVTTWLKVFAVPIEPLEVSFVGRIFYQIYSITFLLVFPLGFLVSQILEVPNSLNNLKRLMFGMGYIFSDTLGIVKMTMFFRKRKQIMDMCKAFASGRMVPNFERGGDIEFLYVKAANKNMLTQAYVFQILVIVLILYRIIFAHKELREFKNYVATMENLNVTISTKAPLPFVSYIPFTHNDGIAYYTAFLFQVIATWLFGVYISAIDLILGGFLMHSKAQLLILKNYIGLFAEKTEEMFIQNSKLPPNQIENLLRKYKAQIAKGNIAKMPKEMQTYARQIVREYIIHHLQVINLCKVVEDEFSVLILLQFITSSGMICFILYHLYDVSAHDQHGSHVARLSISLFQCEVGSSEFISTSSFLILMLYQLYRYCVCGNDVILHSLAVSNSVFETDWIIADSDIQKSFLLMSVRAQRPIELTAAKFVILSLQTFMTLVKTSASYFMFLRRMNEETDI